ncbi:LytR/AlgR family response regulator transcription factor [Arachidicoccus soli]|uniref:DNA-binding response regulator n=1 Tax=Arachidicoccus soli TaxID=2341117 RepID=A0A386HKN2_9BACT|nr:LytTR family DNA-binding domain-containing protein [Arachidicoccus soli]AYD46212.1 DNA-binding response regulator [Arachidicoccus soli]
MLIKALIIDDERPARAELKKLLHDFPAIEIVGEAQNSKEAVEKINELDPDLIFLDIQMPGKNGFEMLSELVQTPKVIFTTAYDEYALKAFEVNALDYLQKPIESKRLEEAMRKLEQSQSSNKETRIDKNLLTDKDQFFVKDGEKCWFVKLADVRLFESAGNYAKVYFENQKPLILKSLNALEERLDERFFFRVNRKHIVNLKWIEKIEPYFNGGLLLELRDGEKVEVSRRQSVKFKEMMSL